MKLLSDLKFDIREYYGEIVIMHFDTDRAMVKEITELLDASGHVYHTVSIGAHIESDKNFMDETTLILGGCSCFIPLMSAEIMRPENTFYRTLFWHFIGFMKSRVHDSIVPYIPKGSGVSLAGSPLQDLDIMSAPDTLMATLLTKFSDRLLRNNYYKNRTTNLYASKRIHYHCLRMRFYIYDDCFENAMMLYTDYTSEQVDEEEFDKYLDENLVCSCKIVSFGSDDRLEPQMMAYKDEVHPDIENLPKTLIGKKTYRKLTDSEREKKPGVRSELTVDILIPVHKLLGVYIKPYLKCIGNMCNVNITAALLESDLLGGAPASAPYELMNNERWDNLFDQHVHLDREKDRLYFGLGFEEPKNPITPDPELNVGRYLEYVYPQ